MKSNPNCNYLVSDIIICSQISICSQMLISMICSHIIIWNKPDPIVAKKEQKIRNPPNHHSYHLLFSRSRLGRMEEGSPGLCWNHFWVWNSTGWFCHSYHDHDPCCHLHCCHHDTTIHHDSWNHNFQCPSRLSLLSWIDLWLFRSFTLCNYTAITSLQKRF